MKLTVPCELADNGQHEVEFTKGEVHGACDPEVAETVTRLGTRTCGELVVRARGAESMSTSWCASCCLVVPLFTYGHGDSRWAQSAWGACPLCKKTGVLRELQTNLRQV